VVKAIVTLGRSLGRTVIAEGIETSAQLAELRALGTDFGQGYLLAHPLTTTAAETLLAPRGAQPRPAHEPIVATHGGFAALHGRDRREQV
jgi:sensor c-di-GMP phosphodiesterase-like protein